MITTIILILSPGLIMSIDAQAKKASGNSFLIEQQSKYPFAETVELLTGESKKRSWNVPIVHDLQQSLAKSGHKVKPVSVIEICKPEHSARLLSLNNERIISVFMPCRISVYEKDDGKTYVSLVDGEALSHGQPGNISEIMKTASDEIIDIVKIVTR